MNNVVKELLNFYLDKQMYISRFKDNHLYQKNKNEADKIEEKNMLISQKIQVSAR